MKAILYFSILDESFMTKWQKVHFVPELEYLGYKIDFFNPLDYESPELALNEFKYLIFENSYDIFMNCHNHEVFNENYIRVIKNITIPKILICFDNLQNPYSHKFLYKYFDLTWLTSPENTSIVKSLGAKKIIYQTYATYESCKAADLNSVQSEKLVFVGTPYGSRKRLLQHLNSNEIGVQIFQPKPLQKVKTNNSKKTSLEQKHIISLFNYGRTHYGRKIILGKTKSIFKKSTCLDRKLNDFFLDYTFEQIANEVMNSRLAFNFLEVRNTDLLKSPLVKIHLKTFELASNGGIQILRDSKKTRAIFEEKKEVYFYKDPRDLILKVNELKEMDKSEIITLKKQLVRRVNKEHLWRHRFSHIFNEI